MLRPVHVMPGAIVFLALVGAGCSGPDAQPPASAPPAQGRAAGTDAAIASPSVFALTICAPKLRADLTQTLGLSELVPASASWDEHRYSCTYKLPTGQFVVSVTESPDGESARRYFEDRQQRLGPTTPVRGLASLGLPAFKTPDGITVYLTGNETLEADATGLPPEVGAYHQTRGALADQIAIRVIWPDT